MNYIEKLDELRHKAWFANWEKSVTGLAEARHALQAAKSLQQADALRLDAAGMINALCNLYAEGVKLNYVNNGMIRFINESKDFWSC